MNISFFFFFQLFYFKWFKKQDIFSQPWFLVFSKEIKYTKEKKKNLKVLQDQLRANSFSVISGIPKSNGINDPTFCLAVSTYDDRHKSDFPVSLAWVQCAANMPVLSYSCNMFCITGIQKYRKKIISVL